MKKLLLLLLLSIGFTNVSFAEVIVPGWIEKDAMEKICKKVTCASGVISNYKDYYRKGNKKAFAISLNSSNEIESAGSDYPNSESFSLKKNDVLIDSVYKCTYIKGNHGYSYRPNYRNCKVLFINTKVYDKALYKKLMGAKTNDTNTSSSSLTKSNDLNPDSNPNYLDSWTNKELCSWRGQKPSKTDYRSEEEKRGILCIKDYNNSGKWGCFDSYKKSGNKCIKKIVIPKNAKASGSSWVCNNDYFRVDNTCQRIPLNSNKKGNSWACKTGYELNNTKNACRVIVIVPANASKSSNNQGWACNTGYKKSGNKCIKKKNKLATPSYRN